jgi:hypothetical protein
VASLQTGVFLFVVSVQRADLKIGHYTSITAVGVAIFAFEVLAITL